MNRSQLRAISRYRLINHHQNAKKEQDQIIARNPAITGIMKQRDLSTGNIIINTPTGGTIQAKFISTSSIARGTVIPQVLLGFSNSADAKPT